MALTVTVTPGKQFAATEKISNAKLNQLGQPTFTVTGTVGTSEITTGSVTADKTIAGAHFYTSGVTFSSGDYTLTFSPTITITDGTVLAFKANANGVPHVTNGIRLVIGASTKKLLKNRTEALKPGDIVANQIIEARYDTAGDGGAGAWQMTSHPSTVLFYYTATATGTNAYSLTLTPPASYTLTLADIEGKAIRLKVPNANTGACTVAVTIGGAVLTAKNLYKNFNQALVANDLRQNQTIDICYEATTDAFQLQSQLGNPATDSAPLASTRNLVAQNNATAPDSKVDVTADEVVLRNSAGLNYSAQSVNVTIDMGATAGNPNALDTGAEAASTWYYVWLIYNGTAVAGLFSASSSAPTLPTGYTYKALVGAVRNQSTSNFLKFVQADRHTFQDATNVFTAKAAAAANTYEILAGADLSGAADGAFRNLVPPIARTVQGIAGGTAGESSMVVAAVNADGTLSASAVGASACIAATIGATIDGFAAAGNFRVPVRGGAAYNLQWKRHDNVARNRLTITGWTF